MFPGPTWPHTQLWQCYWPYVLCWSHPMMLCDYQSVLLSPFSFSTQFPTPLPSGNRQSVLCVYGSISILFVYFVLSIPHVSDWLISLNTISSRSIHAVILMGCVFQCLSKICPQSVRNSDRGHKEAKLETNMNPISTYPPNSDSLHINVCIFTMFSYILFFWKSQWALFSHLTKMVSYLAPIIIIYYAYIYIYIWMRSVQKMSSHY